MTGRLFMFAERYFGDPLDVPALAAAGWVPFAITRHRGTTIGSFCIHPQGPAR